MSVSELWQKSPEQFADKTIRQIISFAGEGKLTDGSKASDEFRSLLSQLRFEFLEKFIVECLAKGFDDSGLALQDLINEVGERLGFRVKPGRYKGVAGQIGFDGIWFLPDGHAIVLEVKTTDAYRISLDTIANYRQSLIAQGTISADKSSILIVVGREDTGGLEAQVRGSQFAWDMRLIGVEALLKLLHLKQQVEDPATTRRIYEILIPKEFTKLDSIIDILFTATSDIQPEEELDGGLEESEISVANVSEERLPPVAFNDGCIERIEHQLDSRLLKLSRSKFASPDKSLAVMCVASKAHEGSSRSYYWYAFHAHQQDFLEQASQGYVALGCGSEKNLLLIPFQDFKNWLPGMNVTQKADRSYCHVKVGQDGETYSLLRRKGQDKIDLTQYLVK